MKNTLELKQDINKTIIAIEDKTDAFIAYLQEKDPVKKKLLKTIYETKEEKLKQQLNKNIKEYE